MILPFAGSTDQDELLHLFEHALTQPPLLADSDHRLPVELFPSPCFNEQVLSRAARYPQILSSTFKPSERQPLGRLFEQVVHAALKYGYPDRTIFANVRLASKSHPGELDFVIADLGKTIHLEVAIKFFLYLPDSRPSKSRFFGPQLKDRLDLKLDKLIAKQLAHDIPKDLTLSTSQTTRALWLTGLLSYPARDFVQSHFPQFPALGLNPSHNKGWWIRARDIPELFRDDRFVILAKPQWIAPIPLLSTLQEHALSQAEISAITEPTFALRFSKEGEPLDRGFIVPNDWAAELLL